MRQIEISNTYSSYFTTLLEFSFRSTLKSPAAKFSSKNSKVCIQVALPQRL